MLPRIFGGHTGTKSLASRESNQASTDGRSKDQRVSRRASSGGIWALGMIPLSLAVIGFILFCIMTLTSPSPTRLQVNQAMRISTRATLPHPSITAVKGGGKFDESVPSVMDSSVRPNKDLQGETEQAVVAYEGLPNLVDKAPQEPEETLVKDTCYFADGKTKFDSTDTPRAEVTVVTGYFEMPNKHSSREFDEWISNFMQIESFVVAMTNSNKTAEFLTSKRPEALRRKLVICHISLNDTVAFKKYGAVGFQKQFAMDPERVIHKSYMLYLVWLGKPEFVLKGAKVNPFKSEYFLWHDIGIFRSKASIHNMIQTWPDPARVRHICGNDVVAQILMNPFMLDNFCGLGNFTTAKAFKRDKRLPLGQIPSIFTVSGSQQCGSAAAFRAYADALGKTMDIMYEAGAFIGKDQTVMAQVAVSRPELVRLVQEKTDGYRDWFLFNYLLRKEGIEGPNPQYTFESCLTRPNKQG